MKSSTYIAAGIFISLFFILSAGFASVASINIPAVTASGSGEPVRLFCKVVPGNGRIYISVPPYTAPDTQESEIHAVEAVTSILDVNPQDYDYYFIFNSSLENVEGGSGGLAMALCLLAAFEGKRIPPVVCATGAIDPSGDVLAVGGLLEKIKGTSDYCKYFLFPAIQQKIVVFRSRYYSPMPGVYIKETEPVYVNLTEYAWENYGVIAIPVENVVDAYHFVFYNVTPRISTNIKKLRTRQGSLASLVEILRNESLRELPRLQELADYELKIAIHAYETTNRSDIKYYIDQALSYPAWSPYSRANYAFIAASLGTEAGGARIIASEIAKSLKAEKYYVDFPWTAEAELRVSWALYLDDSESTRYQWAISAAYMLSLVNSSAPVIPKEAVKELADEQIVRAGNILEDAKAYGIPCNNAEKYFEAAKLSFADGLYGAALLNAIDAAAMAEACILSNREKIQLLFNESYGQYPYEWPEAYRRHGILVAANGGLKDGVYLVLRAKYRTESYEELLLKAEKFSVIYNLMGYGKYVLLAVVSFIAGFFISKSRRRERGIGLGGKEEIEWLEIKAKLIRELEEKVRKGEMSKQTARKILRILERIK